MAKKTPKKDSNTIALNKKARFDYFIEQTFEAGLCLQGWEVKSLRAGRAQIKESYVIIKGNELFLFGAHLSPLQTASTHVNADPTRLRKLLLHRLEIRRLSAKVQQKGATIVPLKLYWVRGRVKLAIGVAKGKKLHDKRQSLKEKDWARDKLRTLKDNNR